ncbi:MAG: DUF294 nucleotidyltransferase-like domain-containing protein [Burkholderiaceae bacterium]
MSASLLTHESIARLRPHPPFDAMSDQDLVALVQASELVYLSPGQVLIEPQDGPPTVCWIVRDGVLTQTDLQGRLSSVWTTGDALPVGALLAGRPVSAVVRAQGDVFCWRFPGEVFHGLIARSDPFRQYCQGRLAQLNAASREALRTELARRVAQERLMEQPVSDLVRRAPVQVPIATPLETVFRLMERERVGSVIVGEAAGIFTRQDVIARVALAGLNLQTPVEQVMSAPLITLDASASVAEAMLAMATHGIRHLALQKGGDGELVGVVTERDLLALQRQGLTSLSVGIRKAQDLQDLIIAARDIREWAGLLVAQGVRPAFMTALISRLNDQLTRRILTLRAQASQLPLEQACWLALGSEGREEQTIATDQDNALILPEGGAGRPVADWLAFAQAANEDLARCGYPLCKGGVMAGNPRWCLDLAQWMERFSEWIDQGSPSSLLNASIFFDFRPLDGDASLAQRLRTEVQERARKTPRFLKQMSDNALRNGPPSGVVGSALAHWLAGSDGEVVDLKLHGTMPLVEGVRVLALAQGIEATGTEARLSALAAAGRIEASEQAAWADAFEFFQTLRLRSQQQKQSDRPANCLRMGELSAIDQRALRESWRQLRRLQQRLALDFPG